MRAAIFDAVRESEAREAKSTPTGDPTLDWMGKKRIPRELWAVEWLKLAALMEFGICQLAEVVPSELTDEIELYFMKVGGVQ
jgi:hypothetical protein